MPSPSASPPETLADRYRDRARRGLLERDPAQEAVVAHLDTLRDALADYRLARKSSPLGWLFRAGRSAVPRTFTVQVWARTTSNPSGARLARSGTTPRPEYVPPLLSGMSNPKPRTAVKITLDSDEHTALEALATEQHLPISRIVGRLARAAALLLAHEANGLEPRLK